MRMKFAIALFTGFVGVTALGDPTSIQCRIDEFVQRGAEVTVKAGEKAVLMKSPNQKYFAYAGFIDGEITVNLFLQPKEAENRAKLLGILAFQGSGGFMHLAERAITVHCSPVR